MSNTFKNTVGVCARVLAAASITSVIFGVAVRPAMAGTPDPTDQVSEQVSTAGLDLTKPADQAMLTRRVWSASRHVCSRLTEGEADQLNQRDACTAEAFGTAMRSARLLFAQAEHVRMFASAGK